MKIEDLEKLSDGELSLAILKIKAGGLAGNYRIGASGVARCDVGTDGCGYFSASFDINNGSDMGPLIFKSLIETAPLANSDKWKAAGATYSKRGERSVFTVHHENPLRAAAIVYLLMQGELE